MQATNTKARSYAPAAAERITDEQGRWECFLLNSGARFSVVSYLGNAFRPTEHYAYRNEEEARKAVTKFAERAEAVATQRAERKAQRKAELSKPHGLEVGDIVSNSWGYDQTNVQYFQITKLCGARTVEVRQIGAMLEGSGHMQGQSVPQPDSLIGDAMRRTVDQWGAVNVLRATFGRASKITPAIIGGVKCFKPASWSNYA